MSEKAQALHLDVDFETARALHRVVRAMHDGECPKCHRLFESYQMRRDHASKDAPHYNVAMRCPYCGFTITATESDAAIATFAPVMDRNLETWRATITK
jgi:DNA-directed RNA polymerase subunit RPC12/RpoP